MHIHPFGLAGIQTAYIVAHALRGTTTRRPVRLACYLNTGQCGASF
ncbi:hypothetical protein ACLPAD_05285 [Alcaligenes aquatilis]